MSTLTLEIASLEMPCFIQETSADQLLSNFIKFFRGKFKIYEIILHKAKYQYYSTPRRISFVIEDLDILSKIDNESETQIVLHKGPKIKSDTSMLIGFMKSHNINENQLIIKDGIYYYIEETKKITLIDALAESIEYSLTSIKWPKTMRWEVTGTKWIRPITSILALLDNRVIDINFGHIKSDRITYGNKFYKNEQLFLENASNYTSFLYNSQVLLKRDDRYKIIYDGAKKIASSLQLEIIEDDILIQEIADMVEWPYLMYGEIPKEFIQMPKEILITSARYHQKYILLENNKGEIAPYFIFVTDKIINDNRLCIRGNQKVLNARLNDAQFFWQQDINFGLENYKKKLKNIIFHEKIGNIEEKIIRIKEIAQKLLYIEYGKHSTIYNIIDNIDNTESNSTIEEYFEKDDKNSNENSSDENSSDENSFNENSSDENSFNENSSDENSSDENSSKKNQNPLLYCSNTRNNTEYKSSCMEIMSQQLDEAIDLCKADLASNIVKEFPELQGIIGGHYARYSGKSEVVCHAITNHYKPQGISDDIKISPVTGILAIADKLDTIIEFFKIGIKPTGSKDPYALRRAAIGILRLIQANKFKMIIDHIHWIPQDVKEFILKRKY
ncbi:glycine--tRNA ligase subunit beta [Lyticum sinuosum]|uniref:glycine--tRNA ligase n=1 Tax=Lyticum sinuosum TaxID=1332059 RepID=A0AAE4VJN1_9RICK|nr:glycine--tRNA ligase subunit beta [Lyticum sinuosum]MDZ5761061.1 Glycine--tRNA ligase beta subunit domain protein [Lyticum sinuosum]